MRGENDRRCARFQNGHPVFQQMQRASVEHEAVRRGERAIEPASGLVVATEPGADQERADALVDERIVVERFVDERVWPATLTPQQRAITRTGSHPPPRPPPPPPRHPPPHPGDRTPTP